MHARPHWPQQDSMAVESDWPTEQWERQRESCESWQREQEQQHWEQQQQTTTLLQLSLASTVFAPPAPSLSSCPSWFAPVCLVTMHPFQTASPAMASSSAIRAQALSSRNRRDRRPEQTPWCLALQTQQHRVRERNHALRRFVAPNARLQPIVGPPSSVLRWSLALSRAPLASTPSVRQCAPMSL